MSDDDETLTRTDIRLIQRAETNRWDVDKALRERLKLKLLGIVEDPQSSQRSVIMATKALVDMSARDDAWDMKRLDKEQPDKYEHNVTSQVTQYQLPTNGRD